MPAHQKTNESLLLVDDNPTNLQVLYQTLESTGCKLLVAKNGEDVARLNPDRIVISPGPGNPDQAGVTLKLLEAFEGKKPILGVCLGHQAIGQAFGGKVVAAPYLMHGKTSEICHDNRTIFEGLPYRFQATRYHSLMVERKSLPKCLEISATSTDGLIMGLRHKEHPIEGVQFHPESILTMEDNHGLRLIGNLLDDVAAVRRGV